MMTRNKTVLALAALAITGSAFNVAAEAKILKVYILAGQSNMEGLGDVKTFDYIGDDPVTAPMLKEMRGPDGKPHVCEKVWISYLKRSGKLTAGFDASESKIGPEFTFGIYMQKKLNEPVLLIKTAWGGKSLHTDFRPPSAGPYKVNAFQQRLYTTKPRYHGAPANFEKWKADKAKATGHYYQLMIKHVKHVLGDINRVCPSKWEI